jgi:cell division protein FtsL
VSRLSKRDVYILPSIAILAAVAVLILAVSVVQLDKELTQEKYLHQQSIESLSNVIQDYDGYTTQLENTIKEWRVKYSINEGLAEKGENDVNK